MVKTPKKYATIEFWFHCECGHQEKIDWVKPDVRFIPAYTNDSGTSWPSELEITCPACGGYSCDSF
jgi:hypothetical protein